MLSMSAFSSSEDLVECQDTEAPAQEIMEEPTQDIPEAVLEPSVSKAAFPFDEDDADITLRTSDNVEFRVHRVILSLASSVFKDMFSMPQPSGSTGENDSAREPITVSEDGATLDVFLRICYPTINIKPSSLGQLRKVLAAATKYDAPLVLDQMKEALMIPEFLDSQPLVVFTIACVFHMEEVAQAAAETAITVPNLMSTFNYPKLEDVSAGAYHRLLQLYRTRTAITEPQAKRRKKNKGNTTTLTSYYTVDFKGITPICRLPVPRTLPRAKFQPESISHPFSNTTGDLILRTSDGFDFYAYRNVLDLASPTFLSALIATEIEDRPGRSPVPLYHVQESAVVLDILLRICYPVPHILPSDADTFLVILRAAQKYDLSKAKQILRGGWLQLVGASPMRFYFAAVELGWRDEAKACADRLASLPSYNVPWQAISGT
ncbi:hypothetical protein V8D89_016025 [Ganoderma adspersum]